MAARPCFREVHHGSFPGIPATGRLVAFTSVGIYRVSGYQPAEEWVLPDISTLLRQITDAFPAR